jgi:hypothetical protein
MSKYLFSMGVKIDLLALNPIQAYFYDYLVAEELT